MAKHIENISKLSNSYAPLLASDSPAKPAPTPVFAPAQSFSPNPLFVPQIDSSVPVTPKENAKMDEPIHDASDFEHFLFPDQLLPSKEIPVKKQETLESTENVNDLKNDFITELFNNPANKALCRYHADINTTYAYIVANALKQYKKLPKHQATPQLLTKIMYFL